MASFFNLQPSNRFDGLDLQFRKPTEFYDNLKTYSSVTIDQTNKVITNDTFLAYLDSNGSGSTVGVFPLTSYGKNHIPVNSPAYQQPLIRAHSQVVQDFTFHPFDRQKLLTVSADKFCKLWKLPKDGLTVDMSGAEATFQTKTKAALRGVLVNPVCENLLSVRSSREITLFDLQTQQEVITTPSSMFSADFLSFNWSYDGKVLLTTTKNKKMTLLDLRRANAATTNASTASSLVIKEVDGHTGIRFSSTTWLGESSYFLSFGQNGLTQQREIFLWDQRQLDSGPLQRTVVDREDGALVPAYDNDTGLLVLSGKGDKAIKVYHIDPASVEDPIHLVTTFDSLTEAQAKRDLVRSITILPKSNTDLGSGEILRVLKMTDGMIQNISVVASKVDEYDCLAPVTTTVSVATSSSSSSIERWREGESGFPEKTTIQPVAPPTPVGAEGSDTATGGDEIATVSTDASEKRRSLALGQSRVASGLGSVLKYRHMYGREAVKDLTYYNLSPDLSALDNPIIAADDQYWAIPYRGGGGPVYISKHNNYGKVLPDCFVLNGHKSTVQEISFSPFHSGLMSTGSFDCTIKIWNVENLFESPESVRMLSDVTSGTTTVNPVGEFNAHSNSVRTCSFHPVVPHLLCSTAQDYTLRFFDINAMSELSCYRLSSNTSFGANMDHAMVSNVSFNYEGNVMALACKDRHVRLFDARQQQMIGTTQTPVGRNLRVAWCARSCQQDPMVTVCSGSQGLRQINLWDPRNLSQSLAMRTIDNGSGQLFPMFDEGLNVVFVAGKGDTIVRSYELANLNDTAGVGAGAGMNYLFEKCSDFQTSKDPIAGICMLPKRVCDVRNVEVNRLLKLTSDSVVPLHFRVPRAEHLKDFFHDDIFLPVRSKHSELSISDWLEAPVTPTEGFGVTSCSIFTPIMESLKPDDMMNVSEKPVEPTPSAMNSKVESFKNKIAQEKEAEQVRENQFAKLQQMAVQNAQYNRNRSGPIKIGGVVVNQQHQEDSDSDNDWDS